MMSIRRAVVADAEQIREIYNHEVLNSTVTFDIEPRSLDEQRLWITERSGAHAALVAVDEADPKGAGKGDTVIGFASLSQFRVRAAYSTSVESSIYIRADHRGEGVGGALMKALIETATNHGFHAMFARIVADHAASIALHKAVGFETVGTERESGRKFGKWLDVTVMERLL